MCKILSLYTSSYWQWFKLTESWYGIIPFWKILNGKLDTCVPAVRKHKLLNMLHQEKINCSELSTSESVQCFLHHGHALIIPSSIISTKLKLIICRQPPDLYWSTPGRFSSKLTSSHRYQVHHVFMWKYAGWRQYWICILLSLIWKCRRSSVKVFKTNTFSDQITKTYISI